MSKLIDRIFFRGDHTCPWWLCFTFDNPLRRLIHDPVKILSPYVKPGQTVLDIGPGMGYFTLALSALVGPEGRVTALDIQKKMLDALSFRAARHGCLPNIKTVSYEGGIFPLEDAFDFVLLFWMAHEVSDPAVFAGEVARVMRPGGLLLIAEPRMHVSENRFECTVKLFEKAGLKTTNQPQISFSRAASLMKG